MVLEIQRSQAIASDRGIEEIDSIHQDWPEAAYLHIPFCQQRCHYCDFATGLGTTELIETYVQALCQQIGFSPVGEKPLSSLFFGGGTPSLLRVDQLERILTTLAARLLLTADVEISLEANPGTTTREQWAGYRRAGINRVSLGVQAFQPELLAACGRLHGVTEVYEAVADLRAVGLDNFNLDLIFGLPHQTLNDWRESLQAVLEIRPPHLSVYDLTIEAGTKFGRLYHPGFSPLPSEEDTVQMYLLAIQALTAAGYEHYEISNFALPGSQCRHNRVYWENRSYYGFGMGAVAYVQKRRIHQPKTLHDYFQQVQKQISPSADLTTQQEEWQDTVMLGLRLREGLQLDCLRAQFSDQRVEAALDRLEPFRQQGWISWSEGRLRLMPPQGWLFSNTVLATLFDLD